MKSDPICMGMWSLRGSGSGRSNLKDRYRFTLVTVRDDKPCWIPAHDYVVSGMTGEGFTIHCSQVLQLIRHKFQQEVVRLHRKFFRKLHGSFEIGDEQAIDKITDRRFMGGCQVNLIVDSQTELVKVGIKRMKIT